MKKIKNFLPKEKIKSIGQSCRVKCRGLGRFIIKISGKVGKILSGQKARKVIYALVVLLLIAETVFAVLIYGFHKDDKATRFAASVIPYPIALANQDIVTYDEYLAERDYIHHFYEATEQQNVAFEEVDKQILDQLIENKLISFQAQRYDVSVTDSDVDKSMQTIVDQNGGQEKVSKVLMDLYGLDLQSFKHLIRNQLIRDKINQEAIMRVKARHILVRVDKDAAEDKVAEAKKKIDDIAAQIKGGADFAEVAKTSSEDVGSSEQGGELEPFARGEMVEPFSETSFTTPAGSVSEPFRTDFGWHIVKVEEKTGKIDQKFTDWLAEVKEKALIIKL